MFFSHLGFFYSRVFLSIYANQGASQKPVCFSRVIAGNINMDEWKNRTGFNRFIFGRINSNSKKCLTERAEF
jgi:hypothetical protein